MIEKGELQRMVDGHSWYHKIPLPYGIITPGWAPLWEPAYKFPADLTGKRVLDVGAWDGFWTFKALANGAKEVIAIDDFSDAVRPQNPKRKGWETFDLCKSVLGYSDSQCRREEMSVYEVSESRLGRFDLILLYGVIYHCRHPMLALDKLSAISDGTLLVESAVADLYGTYRGGIGHGYGDEMVAEFHPGEAYGQNPTNWWTPTMHVLASWVYAAGWTYEITGWMLTAAPTDIWQCRGFLAAKKEPV